MNTPRPMPFIAKWMQAVVDGGHVASLSAREARILLVLARYASKNGKAWPGMSIIAQASGTDRRDVQRTIRRLEGRGLVVRVSAGGGRAKSAVYRLHIPKTAGDLTPVSGGETAGDLPRKGGCFDPETAVNLTARVCMNMNEHGGNGKDWKPKGVQVWPS